MRFREFLPEAKLTPSELVKHSGQYLTNFLDKIQNGGDFPIVAKYRSTYGETVKIDPSEIVTLKRLFYPEGDPSKAKFSAGNNLILPNPIRNLKIKTTAGQIISLGVLEKTADIKGKEVDYNIGDVGEISIAVAVYTRFLKHGAEITVQDLLRTIQNLNFGYSKTGSSGIADIKNSIKWPAGKVDQVSLNATLPRRTMDYIANNIKDSGKVEEKTIMATFTGAVMYANKNSKVTAGVVDISKNPNTNIIKIICDGVSNQKGTKADVIMDIDGVPINVVSAKVGRSQLGQATGHDFDKQKLFFNTVFGIDVSEFAKKWGTTHEQHDAVLKAVWKKINPVILKSVQGDNTQKELPLVKQLATGLIKYSNTTKSGDVDIVKLIATPASPGYKLLRVDDRLYDALQKINLIAKTTPAGVTIYGKLNGKDILLMKARSYYSSAANTVRTVIEGGDLLDILAEVTDES